MNVGKFNFVEIFNNTTGKTSATKFVGVISSIVCIVIMVACVVFYFINTGEASSVLSIIDKVILFFGISSSLMGVKSISSAISTRTNLNIIQKADSDDDDTANDK